MGTTNQLIESLTQKEFEKLRANYESNSAHIRKGGLPKGFEIVVKFLNPITEKVYYLTELSPTGIAYGIFDLDRVEYGYISLHDLYDQEGKSIKKDKKFSSGGLNEHEFCRKLRQLYSHTPK